MKKILSLLENVHQFFHLLLGHSMGRIGAILITLVLIAALFAPYLGTVDPQASGKREDILNAPSTQHWLGTDDLGRDAGAFDGGPADAGVGPVAVCEHFVKRDGLALGLVREVDFQLLALFDFVLSSVVGNDCVHGSAALF